MSSIGSMQRMLLFLPVRYPTGPPHQLLSTWLGYSKNHRGARQAVRKCPVQAYTDVVLLKEIPDSLLP